MLASCSDDKTIRIWEVNELEVPHPDAVIDTAEKESLKGKL